MITKNDLCTHTENKIDGDVRVDKTIVCSERKSTYRYINNARHRIAKIRVDGGLVPSKNTEKCDYLLINLDSAHSFFIELKGSDVRKAIEQIRATVDLLWSDISKMGISAAYIRIVLTKVAVPNLVKHKKQELKKYLKQYGGGTVKIQAQELEEKF